MSFLENLIARIKELEAQVADYEHRTSWQTTCKGCADSLDKSYEAYMSEECERLRARIALLEADPFERVDFTGKVESATEELP
jgi:BMFP domain-containing protein YqiC